MTDLLPLPPTKNVLYTALTESDGWDDFTDYVQAYARACIEAHATPSGWQDIATAPRDGTQILLYAAGGQQGVGEWREVCKRSGGWLTGDHGSALIFLTEVATHWMPLPEPPK